jgi:hypothetical protein
VASSTGKDYTSIRHSPRQHHIQLTRRIHRGSFGDDIADEPFKFTNARRRSNSSSFSHHITDLKTKFEVNEPEPVFEESVHGPVEDENADELSKTDTSESGRSNA